MQRDNNAFAFGQSRTTADPRRVRTIRCGGCDQVGEVNDSTARGLPDDVVAKKFRQQGWAVGKRNAQHRCPACASQPQELPMAAKPEPVAPLRAEPPPTLTPPARRRIMEALEAAYDLSAQRYAGAGTDAQIAEALKVPRAWVEEVRDALFGPAGNERQALRDAAVAELAARVEQLETDALKFLDTVDAEVKKLRAELARLSAANDVPAVRLAA